MGIPAEIHKRSNNLRIRKRFDLFSLIWDSISIPREFKNDSTVHLYKHKGNTCKYDNHGGLSLLCIMEETSWQNHLEQTTLADSVLS